MYVFAGTRVGVLYLYLSAHKYSKLAVRKQNDSHFTPADMKGHE